MISRYHISLFTLIVILTINACTPPKNINNELAEARLKVPGIRIEQLITGKKTYVKSCAGCHALKDPSSYTPAKWEPILKKMFAKAKITDSSKMQLITNYVMAKSK